MTHSADISMVENATPQIIARIDAEDASYVFPLREYLETNGCKVILNQSSPSSIDYHIAVGDSGFVKSIFAQYRNHGLRRLGIIVGFGRMDNAIIDDIETKILLTDAMALTHEDVISIFEFFFTSGTSFVDKRRSIHAESISEKSTEIITPSVLLPNDTERVGKIMSDVFGETKPKPTKRGRKPKQKHIIRSIVFSLFVLLFPICWYIASLCISGTSLYYSVLLLKKGDSVNAQKLSTIAANWLQQGRSIVHITSWPMTTVGMASVVRNQERFLALLDNGIRSEKELFDIIGMSSSITSLILPTVQSPSDVTPAATIERMHIAASSLENNIGLAIAQLSNIIRDKPFPFSLSFVEALGKRGKQTLVHAQEYISYFSQLLTLYPKLAGYKEPKQYLILFQNSNEIRPAGGFIGSIGLVTFADGKMTELTVQDVYEIDGQLRGHVDPPGPMSELLAQEHWYLRDSNWDPDFKISGAKAAWFYEKETGVHVDGVIGISTPFVVDLLRATGSIELPDYNDRISAENFFGKSLYYTQGNFFPGSTQKKDFLGTLARALIERFASNSTINTTILLQSIGNSLENKNIQFLFEDTELASLIEHYQWAGRMQKGTACKGQGTGQCFADALTVVEANVSVSKVNYFVKRSLTREITIDAKGGVAETVAVRFQNTAPRTDEAKAGSDYRSYTRFYLSPETQLQEVTLNGVIIPSRDLKKKGLPTVPYVERSKEEDGKSALAVVLDIPQGTEALLRLMYRREKPITGDTNERNIEIIQGKQAGIEDTPVKIVLHYPSYWQMQLFREKKTDTLVANEGQFEYNTTLLRDLVLPIQFIL